MNAQPDPEPALCIAPLGRSELPETGIFYVLGPARFNGGFPWKHRDLPDGLAFVVSSQGVIATAAHVLWKNGLFPGGEIEVFALPCWICRE